MKLKMHPGFHLICDTTQADPGGGPGPPPLTPRFGGPSYTIWRPSVQFKAK